MSVGVGVAVVPVDVPVGTPMGGYAARTTGSTGVHDPTTVRALVLDRVAIVTVDVCVLHEETCRLVEATSGLDTVVVAAVHTHGGPSVGHGRAGVHAPAVHDAVVDAARRAIAEARSRRVQAHVTSAAVHGLGVAKDRRRPDHPIDPALDALRFTDAATGAVIATLTCYPCHPVVLDASNTLVTADYVHALREGVEQATGAPCIALTGAAGDVNTGHSATESFHAATGNHRTFERAERLGRHLAEALTTSPWTRLEVPGANGRSHDVTLGYAVLTRQQVDARADAWRERLGSADPSEQAVLRCWLDWAEHWTPERLQEGWTGRVTSVDLGGTAVLCLPGEPFLAVADHLKERNPGVLVAGYCDGVPGYLPTADAYPHGGYEVEDACMYYAMPAPFARGSAEQLASVGASLLSERP